MVPCGELSRTEGPREPREPTGVNLLDAVYSRPVATKFGIVDYGRRLERLLVAQRDVSAILTHSGEAGSARAFFVESVLRRVLPPNVVIGSGEIVDERGARSKQQDLLLYRSNFPVIDSLAGAHLYLAEGVLATIEVKSKLTGEEIERASDNITSVKKLHVSDAGLGQAEDVAGGQLRLEDMTMDALVGRVSRGIDPVPMEDPLLVAADERIWTYIFAFDGLGVDTLIEHADTHGWMRGDGPDCVCVVGKAFGSGVDTPISPQRKPENGESFLIDETETPLGWWLGHMLWMLSRPYRRPLLRPYF